MAFSYVVIFILFSIIGGMIDTAYRSYIGKKFSSGCFMGILFCPIYGIGTIALVQLVMLLSDVNIALRLLIYMAALTAIEYIGALFCEKILVKKLWDYSKLPLNFQGRISLQQSIYWLILAAIFEYFYPLLIVPILNYQFFSAEYDLLFTCAFIIVFSFLVLYRWKELKIIRRKIIRR